MERKDGKRCGEMRRAEKKGGKGTEKQLRSSNSYAQNEMRLSSSETHLHNL